MADQSQLFPGKQFISTVLGALETKTVMSGALIRIYLMRAAMAGTIIGVMYLTYYTVLAAFDGIARGELVGVGHMVGAVVFGFALVFIYYSKSELLTSNMMIVTVGAYYRSAAWWRLLRILVFCYAGNIIGGLFVALMVRLSTLGGGEVGAEMSEAVDHKLAYLGEGVAGWGDLFVRAIFCNLMINLAMLLVYNGLIKSDVGKMLVMIASVFVFGFVGFEHSVANTVLFMIVGLQQSLDIGLVLGNLGIVLLGNYIGGGLLIGLYYAYANDDRRFHRD
ncbi:formate/nitrite transporter FocA (FNT family) [Microbacterium halimionae]|uniref:Formate/nitrite transporter FocA (FNT family) n=1 Tax=Microbacterium halimionae TaxID=1526413 RepID=A0A7W3JQC7_9MICO|nr:formate/nitrite transporter family protein [Microbacterium halimionae]MBA8817041.1 formate/nitrite transporter FocA (FNT family) [Microbacterium halimionae]NII94420.1 formate/nitrite transporter FocA (FNT family) [Microbacterium halimionae]